MKPDSKREYLKYILIDVAIGVVLTGLMLLYSQDYSLVGLIDALLVGGFLLFTVGWFFFIGNHNLFDLAIYGTKAFWKGLFGKRMKKTYIEYVQEKDPIKPSLYRSLWLSSLVFFLADAVFYLIYKF